MSASNDFDIILIGFEPDLLENIRKQLDNLKPKIISTAAEMETFLDNYQLAAGTTVFTSTSVTGMPHLEVGQALSSYFQGLNIYFVTNDRSKFEVQLLKKNGFSNYLFLPIDAKVLSDTIADLKMNRVGGAKKKYKAVKLIDIQAGESLPFEVRAYLPRNNKYVPLTGHGQLSQKKVDKLKEQNTNSVFIDTKEVDKFYELAAEKLIALGNASNDSVSETEKSERFQSSVRQLFQTVLDATAGSKDFEEGRELLEQSKKIVANYVTKKTGLNITDKLKEIMGEGGDAYSHAQTVSSVACLLSMATGIGNPEDLAIAALFHDIGIQGVYENITPFDIESLNEEQKKQYKQHPRDSLNLLKQKRITITPEIADIIERHHERIDAKGYPGQLMEHKIPLTAQLLAYADAFEYLTRTKPGEVKLKPAEVHSLISEKLGLSQELLSKVGKVTLG